MRREKVIPVFIHAWLKIDADGNVAEIEVCPNNGGGPELDAAMGPFYASEDGGDATSNIPADRARKILAALTDEQWAPAELRLEL